MLSISVHLRHSNRTENLTNRSYDFPKKKKKKGFDNIVIVY